MFSQPWPFEAQGKRAGVPGKAHRDAKDANVCRVPQKRAGHTNRAYGALEADRRLCRSRRTALGMDRDGPIPNI